MHREPSDIIDLLHNLSIEHEDYTCHCLHANTLDLPILDLCYEAILVLAREKSHLRKMVLEYASLHPMPITLLNITKF